MNIECAIHYGESHKVVRKGRKIFTKCKLRIGYKSNVNETDIMFLDWYTYNSDDTTKISQEEKEFGYNCKNCLRNSNSKR